LTETDCGWPDPVPSLEITSKLVYVLGLIEAKKLAKRAIAKYHPIHPDMAVKRQFRESYGYGLEEAEPIRY